MMKILLTCLYILDDINCIQLAVINTSPSNIQIQAVIDLWYIDHENVLIEYKIFRKQFQANLK